MADFDAASAKAAGYSDAEITKVQKGIEGARSAGYSDDQIRDFLAKRPPASVPSSPAPTPSIFGKTPPGPVSGTVLAPVINMLDYPVRAAAADVAAAIPGVGGFPSSEQGREKFWATRSKILQATEVPETAAGKAVSRGLAIPGELAAKGIGAASRSMFPPGVTEALAPFATAGADVAPLVAGKALRAAGEATGLSEALAKNDPAAVEKKITGLYSSAVRPTVVGRRKATQIARADENVITGLGKIVDNKENLTLTDSHGKEVRGRNPNTLDEMLQAIGQTKPPAYQKYNEMAQAAEARGAKIDTSGAVAELRKVENDPAMALPKFDEVREYAKRNADYLESVGAFQPTVAQKTIQNLNEGLSNFYRSASPQNAGKVAVDDLIANRLRSQLDGTLEGMGLPGYQDARNDLGALISLETEVAHRAVVYGRRDPGGGIIGRLGNLYSGEELARAIVTASPEHLAMAGAVRGARGIIDRLHSPNRAVAKMFSKIEKLRAPARAPSAARPYAAGTLIQPQSPIPGDDRPF